MSEKISAHGGIRKLYLCTIVHMTKAISLNIYADKSLLTKLRIRIFPRGNVKLLFLGYRRMS